MLNSAQKSVLLSSVAIAALMAAQTAFAASGDGLVGGVLSGLGDLLNETFGVGEELIRRLGGR